MKNLVRYLALLGLSIREAFTRLSIFQFSRRSPMADHIPLTTLT